MKTNIISIFLSPTTPHPPTGCLYLARHSRLVRKENKILAETRIPSLAAIDLHTPSTAVRQVQHVIDWTALESSSGFTVLYCLGVGVVCFS